MFLGTTKTLQCLSTARPSGTGPKDAASFQYHLASVRRVYSVDIVETNVHTIS